MRETPFAVTLGANGRLPSWLEIGEHGDPDCPMPHAGEELYVLEMNHQQQCSKSRHLPYRLANWIGFREHHFALASSPNHAGTILQINLATPVMGET